MEPGQLRATASFFTDLADCADESQLKDCFQSAVRPFGIKAFNFTLRDAVGNWQHIVWRVGNYPARFVKQAVDQHFEEISPPHKAAMQRRVPVVWSEVFAGIQLCEAQRRMIAECRSVGMFDGLLVPIEDGPAFSFMNLAAEGDAPDDVAPFRQCADALTVMSVAFHRRAVRLHQKMAHSAHANSLSPREREVLEWVARGKSDWEIGKILGVSERAVKFHVIEARRRLAAVNRTHAVAKALRSGLIDVDELGEFT